MKVERRGKFPGIKLHLDKEEVTALLDMGPATFNLIQKMRKKIRQEMEEDPSLLEERTEAEVVTELRTEYEKAGRKLQAIEDGADWREVK